MKSKVSIIVPIYNAEKWIERCIDSILNQTHKNLEIILINDGSKDKSKEIILKYKDERIIFIDKENTGVSATRNLGIEKSSGDYIMFVDSDDYIESNTVETLLKKAVKDKCDLVVCNYFLEISRTLEIKMPLFENCSLKEKPDLVTIINFAPWNKLYHKNLFKKTDNRFVIGLKYEDAPVVIQAIRDAKKIGIVDDCLFHYVMQKTGETITRDKRIFDIISICEIINQKLEECNNVDRINLTVKILMPYLKNSRYLEDKSIRNEFIDAVYSYLNKIDKKWRRCKSLNEEPVIKKFILKSKILVKLVGICKM